VPGSLQASGCHWACRLGPGRAKRLAACRAGCVCVMVRAAVSTFTGLDCKAQQPRYRDHRAVATVGRCKSSLGGFGSSTGPLGSLYNFSSRKNRMASHLRAFLSCTQFPVCSPILYTIQNLTRHEQGRILSGHCVPTRLDTELNARATADSFTPPTESLAMISDHWETGRGAPQLAPHRHLLPDSRRPPHF
jgi:hypothetical protein